MNTLKSAWRTGRWIVAALVLAWLLRRAVDILLSAPGAHNVPFERWYGHWREALVVSAVFLLFLLGFARPRRRAEWRNAGLFAAFLISLFAEMFGIPLTIYLLAPLLGLPAWTFGMNESHLWAFALDRLGLLPLRVGVYSVMAVSTVLIAAGLCPLVVGWATVYQGRDRLVTEGIYRYLRHPQYLGLILIILGLNIMWPTLLTLPMAPVLIVMYIRLARREDEELATVFGGAFLEYAARTPAFIPRGRSRSAYAHPSEPRPSDLRRAGAGATPRSPRWLLAALSGVLLALALPGSGDQHWLAFAALVPLLVAIEGLGWRWAGVLGFLSGWIFWLGAVPWVAPAMIHSGGVPWPLAGLVLLALTGYLALYVTAFSALLARMSPRSSAAYVVATAGLWVALEFIRTFLVTGFPWNLLGYSQYPDLSRIQVAAVTGVYGVSFAVAAVNAGLARLVHSQTARKDGLGGLGVAATVVGLAVGSGWLPSPARAEKPAIPVALVQGNSENTLYRSAIVRFIDADRGIDHHHGRPGSGG